MSKGSIIFALGALTSILLFFFAFWFLPVLTNSAPLYDFNTALALTVSGIAISSIAVKRTEVKVEKVKEETYAVNPKDVAKEVFNILKSEKEGQALMLLEAYQNNVVELRCPTDSEIIDMLRDGSLICRAGHRVWPPGPTRIIIKPEESEELKKTGKTTIKKKIDDEKVNKNEKSDSSTNS
ncbi:hypothetical protein [Sulfolobus super-elliptical virus]|nr:hypothetical protein [Sulfolobus super-elliptical virus]